MADGSRLDGGMGEDETRQIPIPVLSTCTVVNRQPTAPVQPSQARRRAAHKRQGLVASSVKPNYTNIDRKASAAWQHTQTAGICSAARRSPAIRSRASSSTTLPSSSPREAYSSYPLPSDRASVNACSAREALVKKESLKWDQHCARHTTITGQIQDPPLPAKHRCGDSVLDGSDFSDGLCDSDLLILLSSTDGAGKDSSSPQKSPAFNVSQGKNQDHDLGSCAAGPTSSGFHPLVRSSASLSKPFVSPVTATTRLLAVEGDMKPERFQKPIVRPPFPAPVRDESPVIGLSSSTLLRTCFRIGEAINQSYRALHSGKHVILELYARVLDSERTDASHIFTLCDLFHAKPPYIEAVYEAALWKSVQLFEHDGRRLLQTGRKCRCMGTMRRRETEWTMKILNIWEVAWDDISWVEGIVSS